MEATDAELCSAWIAGDRVAGRALFERHYRSVSRFFRNKVGAHGHDLVQRTFLACLEGRERFRGASSFRTYLFGIAHKMLLKHFDAKRRGRERFDPASVSIHDLGPSPSTAFAKRREQRLLLEALRRIPLDSQVILELYYWENMRAREISEVLGVPEGTTRTRIRSAKKKLEVQLATLAKSPSLLKSTVTDLQGWADKLRKQMR